MFNKSLIIFLIRDVEANVFLWKFEKKNNLKNQTEKNFRIKFVRLLVFCIKLPEKLEF